jgi:hypothetical protein
MEPISTISTLAKGASLIKKATDLIPRDKKKLDDEWDRQIAEVALEAHSLMRQHWERLDEETIVRIMSKIETREVQAFVRVLYDAAIHSVTIERARMLCAAIAGGLAIDESAEMKSRVARALMALEPSDISLLRGLAQNHLGSHGAYVTLNASNAESLLQAGCLLIVPESTAYLASTGEVDSYATIYQHEQQQLHARMELTTIGRAVLRFLEGWKNREE